MAATAHDYTWFTRGFCPEYCITLIRGLAPEEFLSRIGAEVESGTRDVAGLEKLCFEAASFDRRDQRLAIGTTAVAGDGGPWTLGVEWNGFIGVTDELMRPASVGTRIVSHFRNVNAVDYFHWYEEGEVRVRFEPLFAYARFGPEADAIAGQMRESGFDLSDAEDRGYDLPTEASFALAERLTGVRLTAETLREAQFVCGVATVTV
jgi:hypothetical protein